MTLWKTRHVSIQHLPTLLASGIFYFISPPAPLQCFPIYIPNQYSQVLLKSFNDGQGTAHAVAGSEMCALI